jgi:hypothetical protein
MLKYIVQFFVTRHVTSWCMIPNAAGDVCVGRCMLLCWALYAFCIFWYLIYLIT